MKSTLIFFDTRANSTKGTLRGLVSFVPLLIFLVLVTKLTTRVKRRGISARKFIACFLLAFFVCSAIGVQLPKSYYESFLYSILVAMTLSITYTSLEYIFYEQIKNMFVIFIFVILIIFLSLLTRFISIKFNLY